MSKRVSFFILALLAGSCAPAPVSPTPIPSVTITASITPSPVPSPRPTTTPVPPLQTQGPYLLFTNDERNFTLFDADGRGREQFQLPDGGTISPGWISSLENAASPDGKWLAYFTGSLSKAPYDLALHLFDLENRTTLKVADIMAPGYPENLERVKTSDPVELESCNEGSCRIGLIQSAFEAGVQSVSWSPDGQQLAFGAQSDGPSSDIYIFKPEDKSIRRLVSDLENVAFIHWSPNGERILYENSTTGLTYLTSYFYVANPSIAAVQSPRLIESCKFCGGAGWIDEKTYVIWSGGEGAPPATFRSIDTETQQMKVIWEPASELFVTNLDLQILIITPTPDPARVDAPQVEPGTYLVSADGTTTKISEKMYEPLVEPGLPDSFFAWEGDALYSVNMDGSARQVAEGNLDSRGSPLLSPNREWLIVEHENRLELYSQNVELVNMWEIDISEVIWRPDSRGVLLLSESDRYYLSIPDGEPSSLEGCKPDFCSIDNYIWLP